MVVGSFGVNCYLFWDEDSLDAVIIDPGDEKDTIIAEIDKHSLTPKAILLTHGHSDHIAAVEAVKKEYDIPLYVGKGEEGLLANPSANMSSFFDKPIVVPLPEFLVTDEQLLSIGTLTLKVLSTPGHSPGGVCYYDEPGGVLFTGDTLFAGSIGRTDFPGCSTGLLLDSIKHKILILPDSVICFPGHGPHTNVATERTSNPFLLGNYFG